MLAEIFKIDRLYKYFFQVIQVYKWSSQSIYELLERDKKIKTAQKYVFHPFFMLK